MAQGRENGGDIPPTENRKTEDEQQATTSKS